MVSTQLARHAVAPDTLVFLGTYTDYSGGMDLAAECRLFLIRKFACFTALLGLLWHFL